MRAARTYISFTEVTDPTKHRAYNEWHQLDHRPENINLPGIIYGERFVHTPQCAAERFAEDPLLCPFHYLLTYWMEEPMERTWREFRAFASNSIAMGRRPDIPYSKRRLQGIFYPLKGYAAPRVLVSPEALPYRPARGLYVSVADVHDLESSDAQEMLTWYDQVHIPDMLTCPGVAGAWTFVSDPAYTFPTSVNPNPPGRIVLIYYLDQQPMQVLAHVKPQVAKWQAAGRMRDNSKTKKNLFVGPVEVIRPWEWDWFDKR